MSRTILLMSVAGVVLGVSGCCCHRPATSTTVVPGQPCPAPPPGAKIIMPPGFTPPPGAGAPNITPVPPGANLPPPPPTPPGGASISPKYEPNWQPAEARSDIAKGTPAIPDPLLGGTGPKLYPPEVDQKSTSEPPLIDEKTKPRSPPAKSPKTAFPAGIAQFSKAVPGVWNGLRPSPEDGLDWLAAREFRTVLHLRAPGDSDGADRKQVEKLGMTYLSIEVSPQTLTREKIDEFSKIVRDVARQPAFVYDQDGSIAGALWYLYFRKVDGHDDEVARIRARDLGLRENREGASLLMWLAVQRYLETNPQ